MKIYVYGKNEQYIGTDIMGAKLTEQEAIDWVATHNLRSDVPHTTFAYKAIEFDVPDIFKLLYAINVTPNMKQLCSIWKISLHRLSFTITIGVEDYNMTNPKDFSDLSKPLQFAFYCYVLQHKLLTGTTQ